MRRRQIPESGPVPRVLSSDSISSGYMTGKKLAIVYYTTRVVQIQLLGLIKIIKNTTLLQ